MRRGGEEERKEEGAKAADSFASGGSVTLLTFFRHSLSLAVEVELGEKLAGAVERIEGPVAEEGRKGTLGSLTFTFARSRDADE